ncbi:hypothetical protein CNYM01_12320 [Colletotrichum nymphaeae SA-01]|nr:hypothetical protein CNYM01_12320 [Colletotrichum nymphaeae SA-01]
MASGYSI